MSGETGQRGTLRERVDAAIDALKHEEIPAFKVLRSPACGALSGPQAQRAFLASSPTCTVTRSRSSTRTAP
jgi:hypothetical protein